MKLKQKPGDFRVTELLKDDVLQEEGKHHVYKVTKRKLTSVEAAEMLAQLANVSAGDVSMAGLKDRQGVTEQYMSLTGGKKVTLDTPELKIVPVGCMAEALCADNSYGNGFEVRLRDLSPVERRRLLAHRHVVGRLGVPNYFDEQRFGNLRHGQGWIAKDLMFGRHEQALKKLLAAESEHDAGRLGAFKYALRKAWGDWSECREIAGRFGEHHSIFDYLGKHPTDFAGAFYHVSSRLRLIHLYAFQSHIWNRAVAAYFANLSGDKGARLGFTLEGPQVFPDRKLDVDLEFGGSFRLPGEGLEDVENETQKRLLTKALKREGMSPEQFRIEGVSGFQLKGEDRRLFIRPRHLKIEEVSASAVPEGSSRLTFELPRGAYATLVVRGLLSAFSKGKVDLDRMADSQDRVSYGPHRVADRQGYGQRPNRDQRPGTQSDGPRRPQWNSERSSGSRWSEGQGGGERQGRSYASDRRPYQGGQGRPNQAGQQRGQAGGGSRGGERGGYGRDQSRGYQGGQERGYQGGQERNHQGSQSRGYQGGQNRGYQGGQSRGYQGGQDRNQQGGQNRGYQGGQSRGYQGAQDRNQQGGQSRGYQGNKSREEQGSRARSYGGERERGGAWNSKPSTGRDQQRPAWGNSPGGRQERPSKSWHSNEKQTREPAQRSWGPKPAEHRDRGAGSWSPRKDNRESGGQSAWGSSSWGSSSWGSSSGGQRERGPSPWKSGAGQNRDAGRRDGSDRGSRDGGGSWKPRGDGQSSQNRGAWGGQDRPERKPQAGGSWAAKPGGERGAAWGSKPSQAANRGADQADKHAGDRSRKWEGANVPPPELGPSKND